MLGIKIREGFLDLEPKTTISFELHNPAFFGGEAGDPIQGDYSFPITLPLSPRNRKLLIFPEVIENYVGLLRDEPCEIWVDGVLLFSGDLTVQSATNKSAKVYIILNDIRKLKEVKMNKLAWPTVTLGADRYEAEDHAKDTVDNPEDYDYAFFPVWNWGFVNRDESTYDRRETHNFYDVFLGSFVSNDANIPTSPFLKVNKALELGAEYIGFTLDNQFQINVELQRLCLYNQFNIVADDGIWNLQVDLKQHANKDEDYASFLRKLSRTFNLATFRNPFDRTIEVVPVIQLATQEPKHDWTRKASATYEKKYADDIPDIFLFDNPYDERPTETGYFDFGYDFTPTGEIRDIDDLPPLSAGGYWYEYSRNKYHFNFNYGIGAELRFEFKTMPFVRASGGKLEYKAELKPLFMERVPIIEDSTEIYYIPAINMKGSRPEDVNSYQDRIMFLRGWAEGEGGRMYPFGSTGAYGPDKNLATVAGNPANYSLMWDQPEGLYNRWWKAWIEKLSRRTEVTYNVLLSLKDLKAFSFKDKVRIKNMEYFVRKMKITISPQGLLPVEAEMITFF